jgi:hypothetical protein
MGKAQLLVAPQHCPSELSPTQYTSQFSNKNNKCLAPELIFLIGL